MNQRLFDICGVCWGSHGCELHAGHEGQHLCNCCEHPDLDPVAHQQAHKDATGEEYGIEGCVATWPYYGREHMADGTSSSLKFFDAHARGMDPIPGEFERLAEIHRVQP